MASTSWWLRAAPLALVLLCAGAPVPAGAAPATAWSQGTLTPPAGQPRVTAPGGARRGLRRGHRGGRGLLLRKPRHRR
ncbi:hypothetical protein [Methylobacterium sp. A54F]